MGKQGKREFVQVLRLMEVFRIDDVAAGDGGWMTQQACLDGIAIASVLPAPLVIFGTFVGHQGGGIAGALGFKYLGYISTVPLAITLLLLVMRPALDDWKRLRAA